jgi:hypothetical protein
MDSTAPSGGLTVTLASSNPSVASVPPSIFVAAGATVSAPFTVTTAVVGASTSVSITATYQGNTATASFYVDPPAYEGYLDVANCNGLVGWAWDANRPNTPIKVDIYANGVLQASAVQANGYRSDLVTAGKGNGYHGFGWTVPQSLKNGVTYSMVVKYSGTGMALGTTPKSITCAPPVVHVIWMQPGYLAGFGGANNLVIAGSVTNVPAGTPVSLIYDQWSVGVWKSAPNTTTDSSGIWYTVVPNARFSDYYSVIAVSDGVQSPSCWTGPDSNRMIWCP